MKPWHHDKRSRHERGYGAAWDKRRLIILKRDCDLCQCSACTAGNRVTPATEVDHRVSKAAWLRKHGSLDGCDDPVNLQAINTDCHERKSTEERGRIVRQRIGADGYPTE